MARRIPGPLYHQQFGASGPPMFFVHSDLIAFRPTDARAGLLGKHCAHRGASLYCGQNGKGGLRCWYHGWIFAVDGHCLETPNEPGDGLLRRVRQKSYSFLEKKGVEWAYLGPRRSPRRWLPGRKTFRASV